MIASVARRVIYVAQRFPRFDGVWGMQMRLFGSVAVYHYVTTDIVVMIVVHSVGVHVSIFLSLPTVLQAGFQR